MIPTTRVPLSITYCISDSSADEEAALSEEASEVLELSETLEASEELEEADVPEALELSDEFPPHAASEAAIAPISAIAKIFFFINILLIVARWRRGLLNLRGKKEDTFFCRSNIVAI